MARPKPNVMLEWTNPKTYQSEQILKADTVYAVYYNNEPINIRSINLLKDYPGPKYRKSSFSNPGHAFNLCEKLNKMFKTDKFVVVSLTFGQVVDENSMLFEKWKKLNKRQ